MALQAHLRRSREQAGGMGLTLYQKLPALLCALASVLILTLSACASGSTYERPAYCFSGRGDAASGTPTFGLPASAPVAADGVVYVGYTLPDPKTTDMFLQNQYAVVALRTRDGVTLWRVAFAGEARPLAVADGVLIVFSKFKDGIVGLRASDGADLWRAPVSLAPDVTPAGGILYGTDNTGVYALQIANGSILWHTSVPGGAISPPVVDGGSIYVETGNGPIVAMRTDTGVVRWPSLSSSTSSTRVGGEPVAAAGGQLYVMGSEPGGVPGVTRLNEADGSDNGYALRMPSDAYGMLYPAQAGDVLTFVFQAPSIPSDPPPLWTVAGYRLSASGNAVLWREPMQGYVYSITSVTRDAQTIYVEGSETAPSAIYAFRISDGALLWRQPALSGSRGSIPIGAGAGYLFETMSGMYDSCGGASAVHQAPEIRALRSVDGSVAWTQALDVAP